VKVSRLHRPERPSWRCARCGEPWPCEPGQEELLTTHADDRVGLAMLLGGQFVQATRDLPDVAVGVLLEQFMGWWRISNEARRHVAPSAVQRRISSPSSTEEH